ncbi:MAG TPA: IS5 family transposase [Pirellulales bacterium]
MKRDTRTYYASDASDEKWRNLAPLLPAEKRRGRKPIDRRWVLDAILYVVRTGCQWRLLPSDFPNWQTVYGVFWRWRNAGVWERLNQALCQAVRRAAGKAPSPSAAIIDSQSIRTANGGEERGLDAGRKITGRKRHIVVDTLGLIVAVVVHGAYWQDHDGALFVLSKLRTGFDRLKVVFADSAYGRNDLPTWIADAWGWLLQIVLRPVDAKGFVLLPKRWIVERTFAWLARYRRNSRDYERTTASSEAIVYISISISCRDDSRDCYSSFKTRC